MERSYLIRYGLMGQVGRFAADPDLVFERGQEVVIRSHRGTELGEVLIEGPERSPAEVPPAGTARVLRAAGAEDLECARRNEQGRADRFATCQRVFEGGVWPIDLIDVEPLLDDGRTVLHYLGPHHLDVAGVLAAFRAATDFDVMLQPVGRDVPDVAGASDPVDDQGCDSGGCGSGGCGSCGGSDAAHDACSSCGIRKLLASRR
jgi:hypothetical protein